MCIELRTFANAHKCHEILRRLKSNPERLSFFDFHSIEAFLAFKAFYGINCKSSVSKFILIFEHSDSDYTFFGDVSRL